MKVNVRELRIGNLVEAPKGFTHKIERLDELSDRVYHGLRITEKHLLCFGFKKHKYHFSYWFTKSCGKHKPELLTNDIGELGFSKKLDFVFIDSYDNIQLKYVHQVQNLYFALTGKELEINSKKLNSLIR